MCDSTSCTGSAVSHLGSNTKVVASRGRSQGHRSSGDGDGDGDGDGSTLVGWNLEIVGGNNRESW
jgi:hypothetical protein